ncbi:PREDICTED: uncharacterized protein LOC107164795 [Diuraphis noxia]|uniref:uncharacterized protein LOC107164795 n=1 Tax=Diuraphis noxia TaxID=143948 RepID=UPI000763A6DC|nr:PREDICTED: uncharacterized protein LOC107164795 [Diuraphis noxia]
MKTDVGKSFVVCLFVLIASSSCFQEHIQALTAKVNRPPGNVPRERISSTSPSWESNGNEVGRSCTSQCSYSNERYRLFGYDLRNLVTRIANNWWIIVVSSVLPFIVFWQIKYNMRHNLHDWENSIIQKEKADTHSRRLTLPDLTLAKHARRESLAESAQKHMNHPKKMPQCNISQFKNMRKSSFEKNEELIGDSKRVHIIRRRH